MKKMNHVRQFAAATIVPLAALFISACGKDPVKGIEQRISEPSLMSTWEGECKESKLLDLRAACSV